jgi:hypothetical protein
MNVSIEDLVGLPKSWVSEVEWEEDTLLMVRYELLNIDQVRNDVLDFINNHGRDLAFKGNIEGCEHLHEACKIGLTLIEDGEEYTNEDFANWLGTHLEDEVNFSKQCDAQVEYEAKADGSWWKD